MVWNYYFFISSQFKSVYLFGIAFYCINIKVSKSNLNVNANILLFKIQKTNSNYRLCMYLIKITIFINCSLNFTFINF